MRLEIMILDFIKFNRGFDLLPVIQVLQKRPEIFILIYVLFVGFEVVVVNHIEADQGRKKSNVCQGELVLNKICFSRQPFVNSVQSIEQFITL